MKAAAFLANHDASFTPEPDTSPSCIDIHPKAMDCIPTSSPQLPTQYPKATCHHITRGKPELAALLEGTLIPYPAVTEYLQTGNNWRESMRQSLHILELRMTRVSWEGDHVSDVLDSRCEHHQTLKTQAETSVLYRAVAPEKSKINHMN